MFCGVQANILWPKSRFLDISAGKCQRSVPPMVLELLVRLWGELQAPAEKQALKSKRSPSICLLTG